MRVIVVEDEPELRQLLVEEIEDIGCEVKSASNGTDALDLCRSFDPHVVCSDINMPGCSGLDFRRQLEEQGLAHADLVFVFISSNASSADIADGLMAGASHYFTKPVDYERLERVLRDAEAKLAMP